MWRLAAHTIMSLEQNKSLVRRFADRINARDLDGALALIGPAYVEHAARPGMPQGVDAVRAWFTLLWASFPDTQATIHDMIAEGDKVVIRMSAEGTHQGPFMGMPPTGKRLITTFIDIHRIVDGKIVEHWNETDTLGMLQQLGLVPPPRYST